MADQLLDFAEPVRQLLPVNQNGGPFDFRRQQCPAPPSHLETAEIVLRRLYKQYGSFRVDAVHGYGQREAWAGLGVLTMAVLFGGPGTSVHLALTRPSSDIKNVFIEVNYSEVGLLLTAERFRYYVEPVSRHPWYANIARHGNRSALPFFELTCVDEPTTEEQRANRDTIRGFGGVDGTASFAEFLLNVSRPSNTQLEFVLEHEPGFTGVAPGSAELNIWLPGSIGWEKKYFR